MFNNAVLLLERKNEFTIACLKEFLTNYNNRKWGANGPFLITRIYFSDLGRWNINAVAKTHFEFFGWMRIGYLCYDNTDDQMVLDNLYQIRQQAYVVHMNNKMGHVIREGSVCECLRNTFCLSSACTLRDRCLPLISDIIW